MASKKTDAPKTAVKTNVVAEKFVTPAAAHPVEKKVAAPQAPPAAVVKPRLAAPKAVAAAAGAGGTLSSSEVPQVDRSNTHGESTIEEPNLPSAHMSSVVSDEPHFETFDSQVADAPKLAIDPLMAEGRPAANTGVSFSEMTELPPLKEVYISPPPPSPPASFEPVQSARPTVTAFTGSRKPVEKPKVQPREVAQKAIKEIKSVPPKLMLYSLSGAAALILVIGIGVTIYIHSLNSDDDSGAGRPTAVAQTPVKPDSSQAESQSTPAQVPAATQPAEAQTSPRSGRRPRSLKPRRRRLASTLLSVRVSREGEPLL